MFKGDRKSSFAQGLRTHLLSTPEIASDLHRVREICLDPSCEVLLGPVEKSSLLNVLQHAEILELVTEEDRIEWRKMI